jgi:diacylglycerol kinase family enzyme
VLLVNPRSGDGAAGRAGLAERASEKGIEVILFGQGDNLAELADAAAASGADALGMAGGDGSLAVVAAVAAAHGLPFVCVPAGTRNHFALDVGVDSPKLPGRAWSAPLFEVDAPAPVHAGIDGEPVDLSPPLRFTIRPAALRVRISSRHPGASPSAHFLPASPPRPGRAAP